MSRGELVLLAAVLSSSCSVLTRIDTCDPPADVDVQVNSTTNGDQYPTWARSLVRLPSGKYVAAWTSEEGGLATLRATLVLASGESERPCGGAQGDVQISLALDEAALAVAVAVGPTESSPVYFAWRAAAPAGPGAIKVRLMRQDLCPFNSLDSSEVLVASDATDDAYAPTVAAVADGKEALVAWYSRSGGAGGDRIRSRPVSLRIKATGAIEPNGCDGLPAPCTHATSPFLSLPASARFRDGYALAWAEPRPGMFAEPGVRLQLLDGAAHVSKDTRGARPYGAVDSIDLAIAATADEVLIAQAGIARPDVPAPDDAEVFLERFGTDGVSRGSLLRVNSVTNGQQLEPALAVTRNGALFVSWTTLGTDQTQGLTGRMLDASGAPVFSGLACETTDFAISALGPLERGRSSLAADDDAVMALYFQKATAGDGDTLGQSVHARRFDVVRLFPALR